MLINSVNKTLRVAYPAAIFVAVLAMAEMRFVQAGGMNHLFPNQKNNRINRTLISNEVKVCSNFEHFRVIDHPQACSDERGTHWNKGQPNGKVAKTEKEIGLN
ncbi:MAG: hypothetical protein AB7F43_04875 [Bacteriovoracia bacterium]